MSPALAIGVDSGGTKVEGLLVDVEDDARVLDRRRADAPAWDAEANTRAIIDVTRSLLEIAGAVAAVGVGATGLISRDGAVRFAPNVAYREFPLRTRVGEAIGVPVVVDNDANVAAWGEFRFGAGRESNNMLAVTVGTGIGGGIVVEGRLFRGAHGFAAEIGHFVVDPNGPVCGCGNNGCWEQMASGRAIDRLGRAAAARHPRSLIAELAGGDPDLVRGAIVTRAAQQGDDIATSILSDVGRRLGEGIAGLVNILDPDTVVVGGGAVEAGDLLLGPAREALHESVEGAEHRPEVPILPATKGQDAGAIGAAALAYEESGRR